MRTEIYQQGDGEWVAHVYLSRRNLMSLLAKLDGYPAGSAATLIGPDMYPPTFVSVEEDSVHYTHASRGDAVGVAGRMHPETEAVVAGKGDVEYGLMVR